jgi:hypothetical protein
LPSLYAVVPAGMEIDLVVMLWEELL